MKIKRILKAILSYKEKPVEWNLSGAEIREGKAFLHPKEQPGVTYLVKSDNIEISLSKGFSLNSKDVIRIEEKEQHPPVREHKVKNYLSASTESINPVSANSSNALSQETDPFDKYKKRTFTVSLYPEDYDTITARMRDFGYTRADFVLACVNTATKGTMEKEHKRIVKTHTALKKEQKSLLEKQRDASTNSGISPRNI